MTPKQIDLATSLAKNKKFEWQPRMRIALYDEGELITYGTIIDDSVLNPDGFAMEISWEDNAPHGTRRSWTPPMFWYGPGYGEIIIPDLNDPATWGWLLKMLWDISLDWWIEVKIDGVYAVCSVAGTDVTNIHTGATPGEAITRALLVVLV